MAGLAPAMLRCVRIAAVGPASKLLRRPHEQFVGLLFKLGTLERRRLRGLLKEIGCLFLACCPIGSMRRGVGGDQSGDLSFRFLVGFRELRRSLVEEDLAPRVGLRPRTCPKLRQALGGFFDGFDVARLERALVILSPLISITALGGSAWNCSRVRSLAETAAGAVGFSSAMAMTGAVDASPAATATMSFHPTTVLHIPDTTTSQTRRRQYGTPSGPVMNMWPE